MDNKELMQLVNVCYVHLREAESWVQQGNWYKAEYRAAQLSKNAHMLMTELYKMQRNSGEVK